MKNHVNGETVREEVDEYRVYRMRFLAVFAIFYLNLANGAIWLAFSPIAVATSEYFQISLDIVNLLPSLFYIAYPFVTIPSGYIVDHYGLRLGLAIGGLLTIIGSWMNYVAAVNQLVGLLVFGQLLAAIGQPFLLNAPSKMASVWFKPEARSNAAILATLGNPIGAAVAGVISPAIVGPISMMDTLMLTYACIATSAILPLLILSKQPPTSPSATCTSGNAYFDSYWGQLKSMAVNRNFVIIVLIFGIVTSIFNSLATLLAQILSPFGYDADYAGYVTAGMVVAGIVGAGIGGFISDKYRRQQLFVLKLLMPLLCVFLSLFAACLRPGANILLGILIAIIGMFAFGLLPFGLSVSVEMTWPVDESLSTGICWMCGNLLSVVFVYGLNAWKNFPGDPSGSLRPGLILSSCLLFIVTVISQFCRMTYNRISIEESTSPLLKAPDAEQVPL